VASAAGAPTSLTDAAYAVIHRRIVTCDLAPGQRITEKQVAEETGFGATPVREALARLDNEGLVITLPRRGYQVTPLTMKSVDDLFQVWRIVGPELCRLAVRNMTEPQRQDLKRRFARLARAAAGQGRGAAREQLAHDAFYLLAQATGNTYLVEIFTRLDSEMSRVSVMVDEVSPPETWAGLGEQDYVTAIDTRDSAAMARMTRAYIERQHEEILKVLRTWPSVMTTEVVPRSAAPARPVAGRNTGRARAQAGRP
jgi:DNA-binding GntR family transcriptional regulator